MTSRSLRHRFPGINDDWARFDGPAGTQMVDTAIEAVTAWMASGSTAAAGGWFAAADGLRRRCRNEPGRRSASCSAPIRRASSSDRTSTSNLFALTRAVGATLAPRRPHRRHRPRPRREHHAVAPRRRGRRRRARARPVRDDDLQPRRRGRDRRDRRAHPLGRRCPVRPTCSAACPTSPRSSTPPTRSGAACASTPCTSPPHRRIDIAALGCDALVDVAVQVVRTAQRRACGSSRRCSTELPVFKVRPAGDDGPCAVRDRDAQLRGASPASRPRRGSCSRRAWTRSPRPSGELFDPLVDGLQRHPRRPRVR